MQLSFNEENSQADNGPVVCLGMTFENDEERREYFREELRKKLPELKKIEGFPIGEDEDIIALSDPPYYTACPNPWINDFIEEWEKEKVTKFGRNLDVEYYREPFAADVSEGKGHAIYNAHSYHTKVPHRAIMRYLLHYTDPGDIVLDSFSGSGMTGVASQMLKSPEEIKELGLIIDENKVINKNGEQISSVGKRNCILNDLAPAATFISANYNVKSDKFKIEASSILKEVLEEFEWLTKTQHVIDGKIQKDAIGNTILGEIHYVVWSDVYRCVNCSQELTFWDSAIDHVEGKAKDSIACQECGAIMKKTQMQRSTETKYDIELGKSIEFAKQVPVLINYSVNEKRYTKEPDDYDLQLLKRIEETNINNWIPIEKLEEGQNMSQPMRSHGITHVHHFYTRRNLILLSALYSKCKTKELKFLFTGLLTRSSKQARFLVKNFFHGGGGWVGTSLSGTLFIPSLSIEVIPTVTFKNRINKAIETVSTNTLITTQAAQSITQIPDNSIDYIFTDPPFGGNLMYSELNFNMESWLKVKTNNDSEAIINQYQRKGLPEYQNLMEECFKEYYRLLKPNRWITVEFSNSQSKIWNSIQEALQRSGFVVANVSALDKKQGSFKAVTSTTAVKQDLVISAYKPKKENIIKMHEQINTIESAWTFVSQHLEQLPVFIGNKGEAQVIAERTPRILFDRMVAYHVQNGLPVPISSAEFQLGITQRFPMRDGMAFLEKQIAEYDKKRTIVKDFSQLTLFVSDESSAIEWIRQQLLKKPQTRQDIHPSFMKELQHIAKHEMLPELDDLLNQNFLIYDGEGPVPNQILTYLRRTYKDLRGLEHTDPKVVEKAMYRWYVPDPNKQADLEKLREKALLREYEGYRQELEGNKKKLRTFRTEAIRAGFKKAYSEKDFESIVKVGERIPEKVIQEDDKLLMYYDNACILLGL